MIIKHSLVWAPDGFQSRDVFVSGNRIAAGDDDGTVLDGAGCYLLPGLIDLHFHGCDGADISDGNEDTLPRLATYELKNGVTSICPATLTIPEAGIRTVLTRAAGFRRTWVAGHFARLCGINMEGPFVSTAKAGAQNPAYIRTPDETMFDSLIHSYGDLIRLVTVAPELPGAIDFIRHFSDTLRISVGHTDCDYETACSAFRAGARQLTHLYNAMRPMLHRAPGPIGAGADADSVMAELICDGCHVHPSAIRAALALFGSERLIFISDSMRATGLANGAYTLGDLAVTVTGNTAVLEDGTLAGSVTNLMDCMRFAVRTVGIPLVTAIRCATLNPAVALGISDDLGTIDTGKIADLVLLDRDTLAVRAVISDGVPCHIA